MKTLPFVVALMLAAGPCALIHAQLSITLQLSGSDSGPMEQAHAVVMDGTRVAAVTEVEDDGTASLLLPRARGHSLLLMGMYHQAVEIPVLSVGGSHADLYVRLAPKTAAPALDSAWVITLVGAVQHAMELDADGRFVARLTPEADTLAYQVRLAFNQGTEEIVAGTQRDYVMLSTDGSFWDGISDYYSVIATNGTSATIEFDASLLPGAVNLEPAIHSDPPELGAMAVLDRLVAAQSELETGAFWAMQQGSIDKAAYEAQLAHVQAPVKARIAGLDDGPVRQWLLLRYFEALMPAEDDSSLASLILDTVPPASAFWSRFARRPLGATLLVETIGYRISDSGLEPAEVLPEQGSEPSAARNGRYRTSSVHIYVEQVVERHPDANVRAQFLLAGIKIAHEDGDDVRKWDYYMRLQGNYGESKQAENARELYSPDRTLQVGAAMPGFAFRALDGEDVVHTNASLHGRVFLLDFWGTWCAGSRAQMGEFHAAHDAHNEAGFEILSVAMMDTKASVNAYRMGRYPMPWLHAVVEEADQDAVVSKFEVASFPWPILVDAAGRILGLGPDLRNKSLPEVLDGVLASDAR